MQSPKHILVIRFSAMGDVAMTVPVIKQLLQQNPGLTVTVVSNAFLAPLFEDLEGCSFYPAHLKAQHKGLGGMFRLFGELKKLPQFDAVADLHNVLRSKILVSLFKLTGAKTATVDKGRPEKKALTQKEHKTLQQLTPMHERYATVFRHCGLPLQLLQTETVYTKRTAPAELEPMFSPGKKLIGLAPFAQYTEKMYPINRMKTVATRLAASGNLVLLFGGGPIEKSVLQQWEKEIPGTINIAGRYSFRDELAIISNLYTMVSMDSANMHLASLFNVRVVSIWGATHPFAGFYGWGQQESDIVQVELYCRPCSVFGNKPCYRGDHACMHRISEDMILDKVNQEKPEV